MAAPPSILAPAVSLAYGVTADFTISVYVLASQGIQQTDLGDRLQYNAAVSYRLLGGPTLAGMRLGALPEPMYHGGPHSHREAAGDAAPATFCSCHLACATR